MREDIIIGSYNGRPTVTSRDVAEHFKKDHRHVIESIRNITAENSAVAEMFYETTYTAANKQTYPMYQMTRDGFTLLAMGFTGKEALAWKLKYIAAFNLMEERLRAEEVRAAMPAMDARMMEAAARLMNSRVDAAKLLMKLGDMAALNYDRERCYQLALSSLLGKPISEDDYRYGSGLYLKDSLSPKRVPRGAHARE